MIYELYEIRENPLENIDRLYSIIDKAQSLGIEVPPPEFLREQREVVRLTESRSYTLRSLRDCISKYLQSERPDIARPEADIRSQALEMRSKIEQSIQYYNESIQSLKFKITDLNKDYFEKLISQLIGRRLEHELLPNLMEKMGYESHPTTFKIEGKIMEIDGRYELNTYDGAANERLIKKSVIIVECKTTVGLRDIQRFAEKVRILKAKYEIDKNNWGYDSLQFDCWIVGCYGWTDELIREAESREIHAFTSEVLEKQLKEHKAFDGRIPTCPPVNDLLGTKKKKER